MKKAYDYLIYILLIVPPLFFFTDLTRNPYYFQIVLLNVLVVLIWMLWLWDLKNKKQAEVFLTPHDKSLFMFFAVASLSWIAAFFSNINVPYVNYGVYNEGLKRWMFLLTNAVLVYYAAVFFVNDKNREGIIHALFWVGFVSSFYGILQYFGVELIWSRVLNPFGGRSVSTFGNPNFFSSYLLMLMPLLFVYYLRAKDSFKKGFYLIFLVTVFSALLCTMTRSSWLGTFVAMVITVFFVWKYEKSDFYKNIKVIVIPFVLFLILMNFWPTSRVAGYSPTVFSRLTETHDKGSKYYAPFHQRRLIWSCAWHMVKERPVLGRGWGCFELFYPYYQGRHLFLNAYKGYRTHANNTHNEILEIWSQTGISGFGVYLLFLVVVFSYGLYLIKNLSGFKRYLAIAIWASIIGMWVDNLLNVSLHFAVPGFLYWWLLGILSSLGAVKAIKVRLDNRYKKALVLGLVVLGTLIIIKYTRNILGEIHYFKGFKLSKRNDPKNAIPELFKAHEYQRLEVNNNYELANSYARSGQRDKAIWAYKEALRANSGYDEIYFNLATVLAQKGDIHGAMDEYTRSLYLNPQSFDAYTALGSLFLQDMTKYARASMMLFDQCTYFYPNNRDIWNNLGFVYSKIGEHQKSYEAYKSALQIDPDFEVAKKNMIITLRKLNVKNDEFEKSEKLFLEAEKNIQSKRWAQALANCKELIKYVPNSFKARMYLANIYFTLGDMENAVTEYKNTLILRPNNSAVKLNMGLAYIEMRDYTMAKKEFEEVLKIEPNNELARQKLSQINSVIYK